MCILGFRQPELIFPMPEFHLHAGLFDLDQSLKNRQTSINVAAGLLGAGLSSDGNLFLNAFGRNFQLILNSTM